MKRQKKQYARCKNTAYRDQRMQELRAILTSKVPQRIREIITSGKANDEEWLIQQIQEAKSVDPATLFAEDRGDEWIRRTVEIFAVLSFIPGGTTAALGVKLFDAEFDAAKIAVNQ